MSALIRYPVAENALAEAKTIPEVMEICSFYEGIRKTAHGLKDRDAEMQAAEFSIRAQRKLGVLLLAASKAGALSKGGRPAKTGLRITQFNEHTLESAGVDKNLAHSARKLGRLDREDFEQRLEDWHQINGGGGRITTTLPTPARDKAEAKIAANNISLEQWKEMSRAEQRESLRPPPSDTTLNRQEGDGIEWAQWSWNPVTGCKHDCPYCYARDFAQRYRDIYPHGFEPAFRPYMLHAPRNTKVPEQAVPDTRFKNVFTCSMADLFGRWVPAEWIKAVFAAMRENPQWNFLCLTKFPQRMAEFEIPANAWMGTTVDLQARVANAEAAFAKLREKRYCGVAWVSVEPMLEPIKFKRLDLFNWIVIGGAANSTKTPAFHPPFPWIVDLWSEATAAGCAVYMKTNLLGNRVLELPFDAPIKTDARTAPSAFHYLGKNTD